MAQKQKEKLWTVTMSQDELLKPVGHLHGLDRPYLVHVLDTAEYNLYDDVKRESSVKSDRHTYKRHGYSYLGDQSTEYSTIVEYDKVGKKVSITSEDPRLWAVLEADRTLKRPQIEKLVPKETGGEKMWRMTVSSLYRNNGGLDKIYDFLESHRDPPELTTDWSRITSDAIITTVQKGHYSTTFTETRYSGIETIVTNDPLVGKIIESYSKEEEPEMKKLVPKKK